MIPLVIYAYASFTSSWGPGPTIAQEFEKQCSCKVELVNAGDGGSIAARLQLEGDKTEADVVIGIDETMIPKFKLLWKDKALAKDAFRVFDSGPYAFVYNSDVVQSPPQSLDDLLDPKWKGQILLEDPRLSTTGLGFLLWVIKEKGDQAWNYLAKLKTQVRTVSPSWDLAYGLFKKNQGSLVFSYWTSPAYHIQEEHTDKFKAAAFKGGQYPQREYFGIVPGSKNEKRAEEFSRFLLSPTAQAEIPKKNFMYPVNPKAPLTPAFKKIGRPKILAPLREQDLTHIDEWLKKWREIFS